MTTWHEFAAAHPDLAALGAKRFEGGVAYLATVRPDGGPRVHPVTPILGAGRLFVFMEPTSPKGHDLRRDGRYALHAAVSDAGGTGGEFLLTGRAVLVDDPTTRALAAAAASYAPADRYTLFELSVDSALGTVYQDGQPVRQRWREGQG